MGVQTDSHSEPTLSIANTEHLRANAVLPDTVTENGVLQGLTQGVLLEDIRYTLDGHWPFDSNIAHVGFPINLNSREVWVNCSTLQDLYQELTGFLKNTARPLHQLLTKWIANIVQIASTTKEFAEYFSTADSQ